MHCIDSWTHLHCMHESFNGSFVQHNRNIQQTNVQFLAGVATLYFEIFTFNITCMVVYQVLLSILQTLTCNKNMLWEHVLNPFYYAFYLIQIQEHGLGTRQAILWKAGGSRLQAKTWKHGSTELLEARTLTPLLWLCSASCFQEKK